MNHYPSLIKFSQITLALIAATVVSFCLIAIVKLHWHGPFRDGWEFFWLYQSLFETGIDEKISSTLIEAYGGAHRLAITHLLLSADWQWFSGHNHLPIAISLLCLTGLLLGAGLLLNKSPSITNNSKIFLLCLLAIVLFNQSIIFSVLYVFMVQLHLAVFLCWLSCILFFKKNTGKIVWLFFLPFCFFSNFFGVVSILIPTFYFLFRRNFLFSFLTFIIAVVVIYLYLPHGESKAVNVIDNISIIEFIKVLLFLIYNYTLFVVRYLSAPLSLQLPAVGILISFSTLFYLFFCLYQKLISKKEFSSLFDVYLTLCFLTLIIAMATAYGRFDPNSSMAERYQPAVVFYWFCFLHVVFLSQTKKIICIIFSCLTLLIFIPAQNKSLTDNLFISEKVNLANYSANNGITHTDAVRPVLSFPLNKMGLNPLNDYNQFIQQTQKGYYQNNLSKSVINYCTLVIINKEKIILSRFFENTEYQWFNAKHENAMPIGNLNIKIKEKDYPARVIRQSIFDKSSTEIFFILPVKLNPEKNNLCNSE